MCVCVCMFYPSLPTLQSCFWNARLSLCWGLSWVVEELKGHQTKHATVSDTLCNTPECNSYGLITACMVFYAFWYRPFLRTTSPVSGFLVTDTTFIRRRLPPCLIRETTCRWPTFTTLTPFTWVTETVGFILISLTNIFSGLSKQF